MDITYYLGAYSILIPILSGIIVYNRIGLSYKLFVFYLALGFCVDVCKPYMQSVVLSIWTYRIFSIIEILFLSWFLKEVSQNKTIKKIVRFAIPAFIILWIICYYIVVLPNQRYSPLFDTISSIYLSFLSAIILLQFTQQNINLIRRPEFWFVGGTFFSFFYATFLFGLMNTELLNKIWFLYRINIVITYLAVATGFLLFRQTQRTPN